MACTTPATLPWELSFLSEGVAGIRRGKPVLIHNLLNLKRTIWAGPELDAGKHTIVFSYKPDEPGLGKSGKGVLYVDGKEVAKNSMEHGAPVTFPEDETFDIGSDTRTGVAMPVVVLHAVLTTLLARAWFQPQEPKTMP